MRLIRTFFEITQGILLWELITRKSPFYHVKDDQWNKELIKEIISGGT